MTDEPGGGPDASGPRCPWCSATIVADAARCPSCGAALREARAHEAPDIPGVTRVDPFTASRRAAPQLTGLIGWLAGVYETATTSGPESDTEVTLIGRAGGEPGSSPVGLPSDEVRREMLRLEMLAIQAELEAEEADARAMGRLPAEPVAPPDAPEADAAAPGEPGPGDAPSG